MGGVKGDGRRWLEGEGRVVSDSGAGRNMRERTHSATECYAPVLPTCGHSTAVNERPSEYNWNAHILNNSENVRQRFCPLLLHQKEWFPLREANLLAGQTTAHFPVLLEAGASSWAGASPGAQRMLRHPRLALRGQRSQMSRLNLVAQQFGLL